jgi:hypothetical protein
MLEVHQIHIAILIRQLPAIAPKHSVWRMINAETVYTSTRSIKNGFIGKHKVACNDIYMIPSALHFIPFNSEHIARISTFAHIVKELCYSR